MHEIIPLHVFGSLKYKCDIGQSLERHEYEQSSEGEWVPLSKYIIDKLW